MPAERSETAAGPPTPPSAIEAANAKPDGARFPAPPRRTKATAPEQIADEQVATGSEMTVPRPARTQQLPSEPTLLLEEESPATDRQPDAAAVQPARPPPPPRRVPRPPVPDRSQEVKETTEEIERKALRRPWWEELFREDFMRSMPRPTPAQIRREVDFIEQSLGVAAGGVILDLGCGAGHHAVDLSSRGYGVVGYDLSLYQLALAAETAEDAGQKLNFLQGDMRELAFEEMFDGVYCWNTTFGYFEEDKNLLVAQHIFRALRPGGMLLLDVVNRDFVATNQPSAVWYEGDSCVCMDDSCVDFITSRLKVKRSIIFDDGRQRECHYSVRIYSLHELGKLLHEVGFRVAEATGHPSTPGVFFGMQSPRIVILAQRP
jgi:SAM-dependent methyltransferase